MASPRKFSEKIALLNQKQAEETAAFEKIMKEVSDVTSRTVINNLEEMQQSQIANYRTNERGRSIGPMRTRPIEKRHDTSPYSGVPYLSPPLPETWRRTNSDSALHQSANEACQTNSNMVHRRGSDTYQQTSRQNTDNSHRNFIERPRSSCEMPRVPGINVYPSSQPPGQQIPIGNNTGSLPDLSNVHFPSPIHNIDQDDHSSGSPYSNNHLSVPVSCRYLQSCEQGIGMENNASTSQQDVRLNCYSPQQVQHQPQSSPLSTSPILQNQMPHSPVQYVYQQPLSPVAPSSPVPQNQMHQQNPQTQHNTLGSYRNSQMVNRPSPQSSPGLTVQGSPLSYSNNPSSPSSPTGHVGPPITVDNQDTSFFLNQVHDDFAQFSMMDSVVANTGYMNSPNHNVSYTQNDVLNVTNDLASAETSYFNANTLQHMSYHTRTPTSSHQLAQHAPNTPTITLTDCSLGPDDLASADFTKDLVPDITAAFDQDLFNTDDALSQEFNSLQDINVIRQNLDPLDLDELQRLASSDMVLSDPNAEAHFRLEQR